jgi:hypothetical protein
MTRQFRHNAILMFSTLLLLFYLASVSIAKTRINRQIAFYEWGTTDHKLTRLIYSCRGL